MNTSDPDYKWRYRGNAELVHIPDGERTAVGRWLADMLGKGMRTRHVVDSAPPGGETAALTKAQEMPLCAGCYMTAVFNAAVFLAKDSGQSLAELGRTMAAAFQQLADCPDGDEACIESIAVKLDEGELS